MTFCFTILTFGDFMLLDYKKEITPVIYGENSVRYLEFKFSANQCCMRPHWHERIEILYVTDGSMTVTFDDRTTEICVGDIAVASPCELHTATSGDGGVAYSVYMFDVSSLKNDTVAAKSHIYPLLSGNIKFDFPIHCVEINDVLEKIASLIKQKNQGEHALRIIGHQYELLGFLTRYATHRTAPPSDSRLNNVLEYISENFRQDISTSFLSKKYGYDEAYFCRRFKAITGLSVTKYIRTMRLESAAEQIKGGTPINMCATGNGFRDSAYFSRCFKAHFGLTPTQYKSVYK